MLELTHFHDDAAPIAASLLSNSIFVYYIHKKNGSPQKDGYEMLDKWLSTVMLAMFFVPFCTKFLMSLFVGRHNYTFYVDSLLQVDLRK